MSVSTSIARFSVETRSKDMPARAIELCRTAIADCVGCIVAGSATEAGRIAANVVSRGSNGRSGAIATQFALKPADAALINGTAGHALDLDDISYSMPGHPTTVILPAALAVAEDRDRSGRDLVEACVIGIQVAARLGSLVGFDQYQRGWHTTGTVGTLAAVCAVSRLLHLDIRQTAMAIGIAASSSSGLRRNFGSMTKPFHAGDAARGAVLAGELAEAGFTSVEGALDLECGWLETHGGQPRPSGEDVYKALTDGWELLGPGIVLKKYAACGSTHCAIEAAVNLRTRYGIDPTDITAVTVRAHPFLLNPLQYPRPVTGLQGKFSMEFAVALGLLVGHPRLSHFSDDWVARPEVLSLIDRIGFETDPSFSDGPQADQGAPAQVIVRLADGRSVESTVRFPAGDPRNPMTSIERREKFEECIAEREDISRALAMQAWERLEELENDIDLTGLFALLSPIAPGRAAKVA